MAVTLFFGIILPLIIGGIIWYSRPNITEEWLKGYAIVFIPIVFTAGALGNMIPAALLAIVFSGVILLGLLWHSGQLPLNLPWTTSGIHSSKNAALVVQPSRLDFLLAAKTAQEAEAEI